MASAAAMEWVRRAGDFRVLTGKRDSLGCALAEAEEARLEELTRFFTQDANRRRLPFASREQIRTPINIGVQLGGLDAGVARDISGEGMFVLTEAKLPLGSRTMVTITDEPVLGADEDDPREREQWQFAAEVVRVEPDGLGLRFVGIPIAMRISQRRLEALAVTASDGAAAAVAGEPLVEDAEGVAADDEAAAAEAVVEQLLDDEPGGLAADDDGDGEAPAELGGLGPQHDSNAAA